MEYIFRGQGQDIFKAVTHALRVTLHADATQMHWRITAVAKDRSSLRSCPVISDRVQLKLPQTISHPACQHSDIFGTAALLRLSVVSNTRELSLTGESLVHELCVADNF